MTPPSFESEMVFATPWFQVFAAQPPGSDRPQYTIRSCDFVLILALNADGHLLLVRQFRHGANRFTLELPAGHVDAGETPEESARKELCEETGHEADALELLCTFSASTARFTNRIWVYFAANVRPAIRPSHEREAGVECVVHRDNLRSLLANPEFFAASSWGALMAAVAAGKLKLQPVCQQI